MPPLLPGRYKAPPADLVSLTFLECTTIAEVLQLFTVNPPQRVTGSMNEKLDFAVGARTCACVRASVCLRVRSFHENAQHMKVATRSVIPCQMAEENNGRKEGGVQTGK